MKAKSSTPREEIEVLLEHIPDNLLLEPVEYIFSDHCRQIALCRRLKSLAQDDGDADTRRADAATMAAYLELNMPLHLADEEMDLFPRLQARALAGDNFNDVLRLMDDEHDRVRDLSEIVLKDLQRLAKGRAPRDAQAFREAAVNYADAHLTHLKWENAAVLPLARKRLTQEDLLAMSRTMSARRGISMPDT